MQINIYHKVTQIVDQLKSEKLTSLNDLETRKCEMLGEFLSEISTFMYRQIDDDLDNEGWYGVLKQKAYDERMQRIADRGHNEMVERELGVYGESI